MSAKPRPDAKLKVLPDPVQRQLYALYQKSSGEACLAWLEKNHGVKSSAGALSAFSQWYPLSRPLERAAEHAERFKQALATNPTLKLNAQQASEAAQIAFEQFTIETQDIEAHVALRKLRLKELEIGISKSSLELKVQQYEDKMAVMRTSLEKAKSKGGVSKETLQLIEEQLKLL